MRMNWKRFRPASLRDALEACVKYAQAKHNRSVDTIAELIGTSKWTVYKWIESGKLPAVHIRPFEHACGVSYVSQYLALSAGFLPIQIPTGRVAKKEEVLELQEACTDAVRTILKHAKDEAEAAEVVAAINPALEQLAFHRENAAKVAQPELQLFDGGAA